jgi:hypothetical protein
MPGRLDQEEAEQLVQLFDCSLWEARCGNMAPRLTAFLDEDSFMRRT